MSDQPKTKHDCDEALVEIYEFLDDELTAERKAKIRHHLEDCSPCLEAFDFQAELRMVIAQKCQEPCPDTLRQRIAQALEDASATPPASSAEGD